MTAAFGGQDNISWVFIELQFCVCAEKVEHLIPRAATLGPCWAVSHSEITKE